MLFLANIHVFVSLLYSIFCLYPNMSVLLSTRTMTSTNKMTSTSTTISTRINMMRNQKVSIVSMWCSSYSVNCSRAGGLGPAWIMFSGKNKTLGAPFTPVLGSRVSVCVGDPTAVHKITSKICYSCLICINIILWLLL